MAFWSLVFQQTVTCARTEGYFRVRGERDDRVTVAVARAVSLLTTGTPPSDPSEYVVEIPDGDVDWYSTVTYTEGDLPSTWVVEGRPSVDGEAESLPPLPSSF